MSQIPLQFDEETYEIESFTVRVNEGFDPSYSAGAPAQVADIARQILENFDEEKEHFMALLLDGKNNVKFWKHISTGTLTSSLVHPREVYRPAILAGAAGVVFFHSHPSGDTSPSQEDLDITERLVEVGDLVGIQVLDHVIVDRRSKDFESLQLLGKID